MRKKTTFKESGILERQDLERWVENHPEILGEDLLALTPEYDRFDKTNERLSLLAIDKDGKLVVVELKKDDSGKSVEAQTIRYAACRSTRTLADIARLYGE